MARYDATTKHLVEMAPLDWVALAGFPEATSARMVDADVSTVTAQADKVIFVEDPDPWLLHIEFQSSYDRLIGLRKCRYSVLIEYHHELPVLSVLVLLSQDADGSTVNGVLRRCLPNGLCYDEFRYQVIRVWEMPVERLLSGGLGTLPLAPLSGVPEGELPGVIQKIKTRVDQEIPVAAERNVFWESTAILLGMRLPFATIQTLLQGITNMKESSVIQWFIQEGREEGREEGRVEGAREIFIQLGEKYLGHPDQRHLELVESITDLHVISELTDQIRNLHSWDELLDWHKQRPAV